MKKYICLLLVTLILLLPSCQQKVNTEYSVISAALGFVPKNAKSMTVSYNDYSKNAVEPERKEYQCNENQFEKMRALFSIKEFTLLTDNDILSFTNVYYKNASDISILFDTGEKIYVFFEGGVSRYFEDSKLVIPKPQAYAISKDLLYQVKKLLIPDFEKDSSALTMNPNYVKPADFDVDKADEISFLLPKGRTIFGHSDGFITLNRVWGGRSEDSFLRAVKYDDQGKFVWAKNYTDIT